MVKGLFLALASVSITFISCQGPGATRVLPTSSGLPDETLLIVDDDAFHSSFKDSIKKYFSKDYDILPQAEPVLKITDLPLSGLDNFFKKYRIMIIAEALDQQNAMSQLISGTPSC